MSTAMLGEAAAPLKERARRKTMRPPMRAEDIKEEWDSRVRYEWWIEDFDERSLRSVSSEALGRMAMEIEAVSRESFDGVSGGRSALIDMLEDLIVDGYTGCFTRTELKECIREDIAESEERIAAKKDAPFLAERQALPEETAAVPLLKWLQWSWREVMENPGSKLMAQRPVGQCPRRYHAPSPKEWKRFLRRKASANMVGAVSVSRVPRGPGGEALWGGVFHVGKSKDRDRCIDDQRPGNWSKKRWRGRRPGHGLHYTRKVLKPKKRERYHGVDAPNFYHNLCSGRAYMVHTPTGPPLKRAEILDLGIPICAELDDGGDEMQVCCLTVCMGDVNGVTLATEAHVNMIKSVGAPPHWLMDWSSPAPAGPHRANLCIDDFVVAEELDWDAPEEIVTEIDHFMETLLELYAELGIPPQEKKLQLRRAIALSLGAEVNGWSGRVGVPLRVISQLMNLSMYAVGGGPLTKKAGQKMLGLWTFTLLFRRDMFCLLQEVYGAVDGLAERQGVVMEKVGREELFTLIVLAPLMRSSMRWQVGDKLYGSDAAGDGGTAIVECRVEKEFAEELYRYIATKGAYAKLEGDQREMEAKEQLGAEALRGLAQQREESGREEVEVYVPGPDDPEEGFEGQKTGEEILRRRRRRGAETLRLSTVAGESKSALWDSNQRWRTTIGSQMFENLNDEVKQTLRRCCTVRVRDSDAAAKESCGEVPPCLLMSRRLLCVGRVLSGLCAEFERYGWEVMSVDDCLKLAGRQHKGLVLGILEQAVCEGAFGGLLLWDEGPQWHSELLEAVQRSGGCVLRWSSEKMTDHTTTSFDWSPGSTGRAEGDMATLHTDEKLAGMLKGRRGGKGDEEEDESRFLPGRWHCATEKSVVRGVMEWYENATDVREIKRRAWPRSPWEAKLGELTEILPWRLTRAWKDPKARDEHINVLELRGRRRLVERLSRRRREHEMRHHHLTDSRVSEAVTARGRSSSRQLNHEMRMTLPHLLGADCAVPSWWIESSRMPADEPSRGKAIRPAAKGTLAEEAILKGQRPLVTAREVRAWERGYWKAEPPPPLRRLRYGYRGQRVGEAKKPGPRQSKEYDRSVPLVRTLSSKVQQQYKRGYAGLVAFLDEHDLPKPVELAELGVRDLNEVLMVWIRCCYEDGVSVDFVRSGLLSYADRMWWQRQSLKPSWDLLGEWEAREPTEHRVPAPPEAVRAVVAVALAWGWNRVALVIWLTFVGLLRPGEAIDLRVRDLIYLEEDEESGTGVVVVVIREPKTQRRYARVQHVIIDEEPLVEFCRWMAEERNPDEYLYGMSMATLSSRLDAILRKLGVPGLFTLGGLRSGGATHFWIRERNFDGLRLRGRWAAARTLEHYVQECVAEVQWGMLSKGKRDKLKEVGKETLNLLYDLYQRDGVWW